MKMFYYCRTETKKDVDKYVYWEDINKVVFHCMFQAQKTWIENTFKKKECAKFIGAGRALQR